MINREKILLIDFSKVVSPIGISRHLSTCLSDFVELSKDDVRSRYKKHIGSLVKGEYSISVFFDEIAPYLKDGCSKDDLLAASKIIPTLDMNFLEGIKVLKRTHYVYLVSDLHEVLGNVLRDELKQYFDGFIFSFEEKAKKSEDIYRQNLKKKVDFSKVELFVDDKEEHVNLAEKYGIKGFVYDANQGIESIIAKVYLHKDYCVLGAGAAGIIFSYNLLKYTKKSFCVLEKQLHPFGLMKSFKLSNSWYDLGGHALHDNDKEIIKYIQKEGGVESYRQKRRAYVDYKGKLIPFPFQLHLAYLEPKQRNEYLWSFLKARFCGKLSNIHSSNLESFFQRKFGEGIYRGFLKPYNEKLWKTNLKKISCNWIGRIPTGGIVRILKGSFIKNDENYGSNNYVNYPENGGFEIYLSNFFLKIQQYVYLGCKIGKIDTKYHLVYTNNSVFHYDNIITTIPLNELLELCNLTYEKELFKYLSIQIFAVVVKKNERAEQRIYINDKRYFAHKCVLNSNSSLTQKNHDESIIQFEATYKNGRGVEKHDFEKNCIEYLIDKGLLVDVNAVIAEDYKEIKYGYPVQTLDLLVRKNYYVNQLEEKNIFVLGRFGARKYSNFGNIIHDAENLFKKLENENFIF